MVVRQTTQAGMVGDWRHLNTSAKANSIELAHLEGTRERFEVVLTKVEDVVKQQAALAASKQEMSKQLKELLSEGQRLATVLRRAITVHYGSRAEKLTEFRLQPFRGRRVEKQQEPETKPPASTDPTPTPTPTPL
jgi:hypothetical protein